MKKLFTLLMTLVLVFSVSDVALANQAKMTVSGKTDKLTVKRGETVELTVNLADCEDANTLGIAFSYDTKVLTKDGKIGDWIPDSKLDNVDTVANKGVWAIEQAKDLNGDVFKFTFKVMGTAPFGETKVDVELIVKNDAEEVGRFTDTVTITVVCEHEYGIWKNKDANNHAKVCKECDVEVVEAHKWDSGKVTHAATATTPGLKTYTCTTCKAIKTEPIPVTGEQGGTTPPSGDSGNQGGTTTPETNKPETNKPETNKPETNKPETNKPESNKPGTTTPDDSNQGGTTTPGTEIPGEENTENQEGTTPDTEVEETPEDTQEPDTEQQKPDDESNTQQPGGDDKPVNDNDGGISAGAIFTVILIIGAIAGAAYYFLKKK